MGPEKKQDKMCSKKAQKAKKHPERLRTKKIRPRETWRGLKRVREGQSE